MKSLSDLNSFANTSVTVTDSRPSRVIFDLASPLEPQDQELNVTSTTVSVTPTINITDIWNYATANVRYSVTIIPGSTTPLTGSTLAWSTVPSPLSLATAGNTYTITGFTNQTDWQNLGQLVWTLPANYATRPLWYLDLSITYYDSELGTDVVKDWRAYDEDFYYFADLQSEFTLTNTVVKTVRTSISISGAMTFVLATGNVRGFSIAMSATASQTAVARRIARTSMTLPMVALITKALTGFRRQFNIAMSSTVTATINAIKQSRAQSNLAVAASITADVIRKYRGFTAGLNSTATIYMLGGKNSFITPYEMPVSASMTVRVNLAFTFSNNPYRGYDGWVGGFYYERSYWSPSTSYQNYFIDSDQYYWDEGLTFYDISGNVLGSGSYVGHIRLLYNPNLRDSLSSSSEQRRTITTLTPDYDEFEWYNISNFTVLRYASMSADISRIIVSQYQHSYSSLPDYTYVFEPYRTPKTITEYNILGRCFDYSQSNPGTYIKPGGVAGDPSISYFQIDSHSDFAYGTGDFTIEFSFIQYLSVTLNPNITLGSILDHRTSNTDSSIYIKITDIVSGVGGTVEVYIGNTLVISSNDKILTGGLYHCALVRQSGTLKLYVSGQVQTQTYSDSTNYAQRAITVMSNWNQSNILQRGGIQDLKISNIAQYTTNFTQRLYPLVPNDTNTVLMIRPGFQYPNTGSATATELYDDCYIRKHKLSQYYGRWISSDGQYIVTTYNKSNNIRILNYNAGTTNWDVHSTISSGGTWINSAITNEDCSILTNKTCIANQPIRIYTRSGTTWTQNDIDATGIGVSTGAVSVIGNRLCCRIRQTWPGTSSTYFYSMAIFELVSNSWYLRQQIYDDSDLFNSQFALSIGQNSLGQIEIYKSSTSSVILTEIAS